MAIVSEDAIIGNDSLPIFVMGCQRSGTTLLARILDSHSRVAVYLGTHYYPLFGPDRHRYGDIGKSSNLMRLIGDFRQAMQARRVPPPGHGCVSASAGGADLRRRTGYFPPVARPATREGPERR